MTEDDMRGPEGGGLTSAEAVGLAPADADGPTSAPTTHSSAAAVAA
jgi:hypothetical protein